MAHLCVPYMFSLRLPCFSYAFLRLFAHFLCVSCAFPLLFLCVSSAFPILFLCVSCALPWRSLCVSHPFPMRILCVLFLFLSRFLTFLARFLCVSCAFRVCCLCGSCVLLSVWYASLARFYAMCFLCVSINLDYTHNEDRLRLCKNPGESTTIVVETLMRSFKIVHGSMCSFGTTPNKKLVVDSSGPQKR